MNKVIDLFSGAGGFSSGFQKAGFEIESAVEFDKNIAMTYTKNHPSTIMYVDDIKNLDQESVFNKSDADVIIGGPPCQGFSMAGARIREGFLDDPRNYLFKHYFNIVRVVNPKIFVIENVKGLLSMKNGDVFEEIKSIFENPLFFKGQSYNIYFKVFKATDFGIPQKRERVIVIGSKYDFNLNEEIKKTKNYVIEKIDSSFFEKVSVWDAISNLPEATKDGIVSKIYPHTKYQKFLADSNNATTNHTATNHSEKAIERIKKIKINQNYRVLKESIKSVHSGSYGRLDPFGTANTVTTRYDTPSGGKFIHPYLDRTITHREAARLQSFPDWFSFVGPKTSIQTQIGNAVPPKLAYFIGLMVRGILWEKMGS